jgi:hypothetical protein
MSALWIVAAVSISAASAAGAAYVAPPETAKFASGPNVDLAARHCQTCHSADYITTQPPQVADNFWQAEVTKMIGVFGARIPEDDARKIVDYLNSAYRAHAPR